MMRKYTCPYCFREHEFGDVEFRCVNEYCEEKVLDEQYAKYLRMKKESMKLTNATFCYKGGLHKIFQNFMPMSENCPFCGTKSSVRVCPSCHNQLPDGIQDNEDMIIAVLGSRDTGKTHFITVLIHELASKICQNVFNGAFNPINEKVYKHYRYDFFYRLYEQNVLLDLSVVNFQRKGNMVEEPLIYEMAIPLNKNVRRIKKITLVFLDILDRQNQIIDIEEIKYINRYICKASGIIFLLDPLQIKELRNNMEEEEIKTSSSICAEEIQPQEMILQKIANLIREGRGMKNTSLIDTPIAITVSKFDVLKRFFSEGSIVLKPSGYSKDGRFNKNECLTVSNEVETMLNEWKFQNFTKVVNTIFKNYTYCAVSALGQQPVSGKGWEKIIQSVPKPHRIEDPLLWVLKENWILKEE